MPAKLTTTVSKIAQVPNKTNSAIVEEFYTYMKAKGSSEHHQNNVLKTVIAYANFLGSKTTFFDIQQKNQIASFLDTKVKPPEQDPERKWITTYNHYLRRLKQFFRWLYNHRGIPKPIFGALDILKGKADRPTNEPAQVLNCRLVNLFSQFLRKDCPRADTLFI